MKRLIIDLDHTICIPVEGSDQSTDPNAKYSDAKPVDAVISRLREYKQQGFEIVIHTARNMRTYAGDAELIRLNTLPIILAWLERHDVPFDEVVVAKPWCGFDGFYIDDRAIRPSEFAYMTAEEITLLLAQERGE